MTTTEQAALAYAIDRREIHAMLTPTGQDRGWADAFSFGARFAAECERRKANHPVEGPAQKPMQTREVLAAEFRNFIKANVIYAHPVYIAVERLEAFLRQVGIYQEAR